MVACYLKPFLSQCVAEELRYINEDFKCGFWNTEPGKAKITNSDNSCICRLPVAFCCTWVKRSNFNRKLEFTISIKSI